MPKQKNLLTLKEAGEVLGVSKRRMLDFVRSGRLRTMKLGGMYVVKRENLFRPEMTRTNGQPKGTRVVYYLGKCPECLRAIKGARDSLGNLMLRRHRNLNRMACSGRNGLELDVVQKSLIKRIHKLPVIENIENCKHHFSKIQLIKQWRGPWGWRAQWRCKGCGVFSSGPCDIEGKRIKEKKNEQAK